MIGFCNKCNNVMRSAGSSAGQAGCTYLQEGVNLQARCRVVASGLGAPRTSPGNISPLFVFSFRFVFGWIALLDPRGFGAGLFSRGG